MPTPLLAVSEPDLIALKDLVIRELGHPVISKTDCDLLLDLIEQRTQKLISVNTLRRFFEVMPNESKPSLETLNVLSSFCGYSNFYDFRDAHPRNVVGNDLTKQSVNELYAMLGDVPQFYRMLNWSLRLAFKERNIAFLKTFFDLDVFWQKPDYTNDQIKSTLITFGTHTRSNQPLFKNLINHYANHPIAQALYFEWFVDYDFLPTQHYEAITQYARSKSDEEAQLFSSCILFLQAFMLNDKETSLKLLKRINAIDFSSMPHPFPLGRKMACNLLAQKFFYGKVDLGLINQVFDLEKHMPRNGALGKDLPSYHMLMAEAFSWCGLYDEAIAISELALRSYKTEITEHSKGILSSLWMYYAYALSKCGRIEESIKNFERVNSNNFDVQNRNFSLMNYYKIGSQIKQKINPKESNLLLKSSLGIVNAHKFKFFEKIDL